MTPTVFFKVMYHLLKKVTIKRDTISYVELPNGKQAATIAYTTL